MLSELAVSTAMVMLTVFIHGAGLMLLTRLLRTEAAEERKDRIPAASLRALGFMMLLTLGLMVLHGLEIWAYAALYLGIGALPDLRTSVYFSTITYGTIGFDNEGFAGRLGIGRGDRGSEWRDPDRLVDRFPGRRDGAARAALGAARSARAVAGHRPPAAVNRR